MNETSTRRRRACKMSSTRLAPGSSARKAKIAEVSRTNRLAMAIAAAIATTILQETRHRSALSRATQGRDGIIGDRDDASSIPFDYPFEAGVRGDAELPTHD